MRWILRRSRLFAATGTLVLGIAIALKPALESIVADNRLHPDTVTALNAFGVLLVPIAILLFAAAYSRGVRAVLQTSELIFSIPFLTLLAFAFFKWFAGLENVFYLRVVSEDGPVETIGCIAFFVAAVLSFLTARHCWRSKMHLAGAVQFALALFTVFLGLEEINYGQRMLDFDTPPAIAADNYQESFNLHNMTSLEWLMDVLGPDLIIYWGLFGWLAIAAAQRMTARPSWRASLKFLAPPWHIASYFVPYALWAYIDVCCDERAITVWQDQEPAETTLAIAFFAFALWAFLSRTRGMNEYSRS